MAGGLAERPGRRRHDADARTQRRSGRSETGWSGSGGGPSAYESATDVPGRRRDPSTTTRANPDVAYDASPSTGFAVYDSYPYEIGGRASAGSQVGGTSAGAPQWAALLAIADQGRAADQPAGRSTARAPRRS